MNVRKPAKTLRLSGISIKRAGNFILHSRDFGLFEQGKAASIATKLQGIRYNGLVVIPLQRTAHHANIIEVSL